MAIYLAQKTLDLIKSSVEKDQGAAYRTALGKVIPHIKDVYESDNSFRRHLGASIIGIECARQIYYSFRWFKKRHFSDQRLRLVNRGHLEEARFIALFLSIGCQVYQQDENGKQF